MNIISFDVGIRNLAYCYCKVDTNIEIIKWDIINLLVEKKCYGCDNKPLYSNSKKDIYFCDKHKNIFTKIKHYVPLTCKTVKIDILKIELIKKLDMIFLPILFKSNIDYVLIENQPTFKNPKMKAIADTLYSWFLIRGINDLKTIKNLKYILPINKNKIFKNKIIKYNYSENKNIAIDITLKYLDKISIEWKNFLIKNKKKDDLADCFLQLIHFIKY
jgi:hypothetical protein